MVKILIMGLPGSGKTTLAQSLRDALELKSKTVTWINADQVRQEFNDWDFSHEGRLRQSKRMSALADASPTNVAICDFVCPTKENRDIFKADFTIWMDTVSSSRFEDTNKVFVPPSQYNYRITEWTQNAGVIAEVLKRLA